MFPGRVATRGAQGRNRGEGVDGKPDVGAGDAIPVQPRSNVFRVVRNGPLLARGDLVFASEDGQVVSRRASAALCRCGHSGSKPFCDGSHLRVAFTDPDTPPPTDKVQPLSEGEPTEGPVTIVVKPTGSLRLVGPLTVVDAEGRLHVGGRASLCRCGASKGRPWCDNTHREIGFRAD